MSKKNPRSSANDRQGSERPGTSRARISYTAPSATVRSETWRGWFDTAENVQTVFATDPIPMKLFTYNVSLGRISKDTLSCQVTAVRLCTIARYALSGNKKATSETHRAVTIGEMMAPHLPDNYRLNSEIASNVLDDSIKYLIHNNIPETRAYSPEQWRQEISQTFDQMQDNAIEAAIAEAEANNVTLAAEDVERRDDLQADARTFAPGDGHIIYVVKFPRNDVDHGVLYAAAEEEHVFVQIPEDPYTWTPWIRLQYLWWLARHVSKNDQFTPLDMFITSYVSYAKRGCVSAAFVTKIEQGVENDLGKPMTLEADVVAKVYQLYGTFINEDNAEVMFQTWLNNLPPAALRIRVTLEQVSCSGLTAYTISGRAMRIYHDFDWKHLDDLTGGEMKNFIAAMNAVGDNKFYGFRKDLGPARSTMFSSVAYVAKELMIALRGESSLKDYRGWIKTPKGGATVIQMVKDYIERKKAELLEQEPSAESKRVAEEAINMVSSPEMANIFSN